MQLNIYVPKDKIPLVEHLHTVARRTGRQKNELVLDALEQYLGRTSPQLAVFHLGEVALPTRDELYLDRRAT